MRRQTGFLAYLIACAAGWIQRHEAEVIEYLKAENRTLRELVARKWTYLERRASWTPSQPANSLVRVSAGRARESGQQ
jgi:hypothetical protein